MSFEPGRAAAWEEFRSGLVQEATQHGPSLVAWDIGMRTLTGPWGGGEESTEEEARVRVLAQRACALLLVPDTGTAPLVPRSASELPSVVTTLQRMFTAEDLTLLAGLADERAPAALRARVHDLRWILLRDAPSADTALASYLEIALAADLARVDQAHAAGDALLRAANLGLERRDTARVESVFRELLPRVMDQAPAATLHRFFQAAEHLRGLGRIFLANIAITRAESEMTRQEYGWSRAFFVHARRALIAAYRGEDARTLAAVRAHVLAEQSRLQVEQGQPAWVAASFLDYALDELRLLQGTREQLDSLETERRELLEACPAPSGSEGDGGRMAMVLEEVLRAFEMIDPLLRWRFVGTLPLDPMEGLPISTGPECLDVFQRRFGERASGRVLPRPAPTNGGAPRVDEERVRAWTRSVLDWQVPVIRALRQAARSDRQVLGEALDHLLESSTPAVAERAPHLRRGLEACWDGDGALAVQSLVPEIRRLRAEPTIRAGLAGSGALALVDAALLDHPSGMQLGLASNDAPSAGQSDLLLWWTLSLIGHDREAAEQGVVTV